MSKHWVGYCALGAWLTFGAACSNATNQDKGGAGGAPASSAPTGISGAQAMTAGSAAPNVGSGGHAATNTASGGKGASGGTPALSGSGGQSASAAGSTSTSGASGGTLGASGMPAGGGSGAAAGGGASGTGSFGTVPPPASDYGAMGPFDAKVFNNVGPNSNYTLVRPDTTLGKDGFMHPIAAWGNGIMTTPDMYTSTLTLIASHGFVIIAVNDTMVEEPAVTAGLDWLVQQNTADGPMKGKLDIMREALVGYSWGGGAVIDASARPNLKCTTSLHGMPPRKSDAFDTMHAPLLLFTSTGDSFVTADGYVTPNYMKSKVQTFYATLDDPTAGHLYVADPGTNIVCTGGTALGLGECRGDPDEHAPTIAWLRLWVYGEQEARKFFYGDDCVLCQKPWTMPQRKNWQ